MAARLTKRPVSWWVTTQGRAVSAGAISGLGVTLTLANFAPHTFCVDYYRNFVRLYSNGKEVPLNKELEARFNKCLDVLKIPEMHKNLLAPFTVFGYDLFHAGSYGSKFGATIGIPANFNYKTQEDIDKENIQVNLKKVDWNSEVGQKLANALILPEKVQEFAICREILSTQNNKIFLDGAYPFISLSIIYMLGQNLNRRMNLFAAPKIVRLTLYSLLTTFGCGIYFLLKDYTEVMYETKVDKKLCELGPEFIESGVIFYDKIIKRNQALRELMGAEGKQKYSKLGNENFFLRQPRIALIHRKMFFEQKLKGEELN